VCAREKKIKIERESESVYVSETDHQSIYIYQKKTIKETSGCQKRPLYVKETSKCGQKRRMYVKREDAEGKYEVLSARTTSSTFKRDLWMSKETYIRGQCA